MPISLYQRIEGREIIEGYRGYMEFDIAFVSWIKVLLDLLKVSKLLSFDPVFSMTKSFVFDFKQRKMIEFEEKFFGDFAPF